MRPTRANTTVFRYSLYQILYAILAILIYLLVLFQPDISGQLLQIISWFVKQGTPDITDAQPLVVATFLVLIFPNVPPFRWADTSIRRLLYERALIPAQQLREVNRLKMAPYHPPPDLFDRMRDLAIAEGFNPGDIIYDGTNPTTHSLWSKSLLLIEHIKTWEADDHYKTAFAALKEPDSEERSVDFVKEMQRDLIADGRVCFDMLREKEAQNEQELIDREDMFRSNCRNLLKKIYSVLAGISLHSHYSDKERIKQFGSFGLQLEPEACGPMPDANDMLILIIILCCLIVLPLAYNFGLLNAVLIGTIMLSAVLSPVILARFCPGLKVPKRKRYGPNVIYPLLSGVLAAFAGFLIFFISGQYVETSSFCEFTGYQRYANCSYPWSILHGSIALLLANRLSTGKYPDVMQLQGWRRYREWGNFGDATICAVCMLLITAFVVLPLLVSLRPEPFEDGIYWMIILRMTLVAFILGFIVPTWYRAQRSLHSEENRRKNSAKRERFQQKLISITQGRI